MVKKLCLSLYFYIFFWLKCKNTKNKTLIIPTIVTINKLILKKIKLNASFINIAILL